MVLGSGQLEAASTTVGAPYPGEDNHRQILDSLYGGSFTASGSDFSNGTVQALRVDDEADQLWSLSDPINASVRAVFAGLDQSFGYIPGDDGSTDDFVELFDASGTEYSVSGSASNVDLGDGDIRWARKGSNGIASSRNTDNLDDKDHLITYSITGLPDVSEPVYLLLFEDLFGNTGADNDYNDLVVEISSVAHAPTPAAAGAGLMLLGVAGFARRRRPRQA
ncbi:MAG: DUF4114 domain-containing protein [Phycisphaeraceae bacterium]